MNQWHRAVSLPASEYKSMPINDNNNSLTSFLVRSCVRLPSYVVASFSEERKIVQLKMKVSRNIYSQPARYQNI